MRRVVITGIGLITPLGIGTEETWGALLEGRSGVGPIQSFDASSLRTQLGGEICAFNPSEFITQRRTLKMMTRNDQFALAGAILAVRDSGFEFNEDNSERAGLFVGGNKEVADPKHLLDAVLVSRNADGTVEIHRFGESAQSTAYPLFYVEGLQAASLFYISQAFSLKGANTYFAGTAESSATAVGRAYRAIRRGEADVVIAGGFDDAVSWWNMTKLDALGIMTDRNDLGAQACRPFDRNRTGTVMGEGAAFLVLEEYESAAQRDARLYAEITGFGSAYDAYQLLVPHPEGRGLARAIQAALREAGSSPQDIDYVVTHGTGTREGDASEAAALGVVFDSTGNLAASSTKGATGHLMAGAGSLNAGVAALAIYHQIAPPTVNLEDPEPDSKIDWLPGRAREAKVEQALALAEGMEGQNVALAMRAVQ
jgi:3-oxoacyl-[acyl-carrier-protein] synthase II